MSAGPRKLQMVQPGGAEAGRDVLKLPRTSSDPGFERLLATAMPRLRAFLRRMAETEADADDALQECCVRAWRSRERFDPARGSFSAW